MKSLAEPFPSDSDYNALTKDGVPFSAAVGDENPAACNIQTILCDLWKKEKTILESNKKSFTHLAQLISTKDIGLGEITAQELETRVRSIAKLECCPADLLCNIEKLLEQLDELQSDHC